MTDILTPQQKTAIEVLAQGGYKLMEVEYDANLSIMHGTFLHLNGDCSLLTLPITEDGRLVIT